MQQIARSKKSPVDVQREAKRELFWLSKVASTDTKMVTLLFWCKYPLGGIGGTMKNKLCRILEIGLVTFGICKSEALTVNWESYSGSEFAVNVLYTFDPVGNTGDDANWIRIASPGLHWRLSIEAITGGDLRPGFYDPYAYLNEPYPFRHPFGITWSGNFIGDGAYGPDGKLTGWSGSATSEVVSKNVIPGKGTIWQLMLHISAHGPAQNLPDTGNTAMLLGVAVTGLVALRTKVVIADCHSREGCR